MRIFEIAETEVMQMTIRQEIDWSEESRFDYRLPGVLGGQWPILHRGFSLLRDGERQGGLSH